MSIGSSGIFIALLYRNMAISPFFIPFCFRFARRLYHAYIGPWLIIPVVIAIRYPFIPDFFPTYFVTFSLSSR